MKPAPYDKPSATKRTFTASGAGDARQKIILPLPWPGLVEPTL
jgi:hypothetical protein